mgnify:CR=1 FL=1
MQSVRRPSVAYSCNGKVRSVESAGGGLSGTHLEVVARRLAKELPLAREALKDDRVGALAVELDLAIGHAHDGRHTLACRVELEDVEDLILTLPAVDGDKDRLRLARLRYAPKAQNVS